MFHSTGQEGVLTSSLHWSMSTVTHKKVMQNMRGPPDDGHLLEEGKGTRLDIITSKSQLKSMLGYQSRCPCTDVAHCTQLHTEREANRRDATAIQYPNPQNYAAYTRHQCVAWIKAWLFNSQRPLQWTNSVKGWKGLSPQSTHTEPDDAPSQQHKGSNSRDIISSGLLPGCEMSQCRITPHVHQATLQQKPGTTTPTTKAHRIQQQQQSW